MIGTWIIAVVGYGMALWGALGFIAALIDVVRFGNIEIRRTEEAKTAARCAFVALVFAAGTRWLIGGAL